MTLPTALPTPVPTTGTTDPSSPPKNPPIADPAEALAFSFMDSSTSLPLATSNTVPTAKEIKPDAMLVFAKLRAFLVIVLSAVYWILFDTTLSAAFLFTVIID